MEEINPKPVLVISPMRVGSTVFAKIIRDSYRRKYKKKYKTVFKENHESLEKDERLVKTHSPCFDVSEYYSILLKRNYYNAILSRINYSIFIRPNEIDRFGNKRELEEKEKDVVEQYPNNLSEATMLSIENGLVYDFYNDILEFEDVKVDSVIYYEDLLNDCSSTVKEIENDLNIVLQKDAFEKKPPNIIGPLEEMNLRNYIHQLSFQNNPSKPV